MTFPVIVYRGDEYHSAGEAFGGVRDDAVQVHEALVADLAGDGGMAGTDTAGQAWAKPYDDAVAAALSTSSRLVESTGRVADLIAVGAHNHDTADTAAMIGHPLPPAPPPPGYTPCLLAVVPSAYGGGGPEPMGWSLVRKFSGLVWPDGHQDRLRAAHDTWCAAAKALEDSSLPIPTAVGLLTNQQSDEIPAATATAADMGSTMLDLAAAYRALGDSCSDYAQHLDDPHHEILEQLRQMLVESAIWEGVMGVGAFFTAGLSELGNTALGARLAIYITRIGAATGKLVAKVTEIATRVAEMAGRLRGMLAKLTEWLSKAKTKLFDNPDPVGAPGPLPRKPPAVKPTVTSPKLQNILNDLYKGANNPGRAGDGTTADALRNEFRVSEPTEGKWHLQKALESQKALAKWLMDKANTDPGDRTVAIAELRNLWDAMAGR